MIFINCERIQMSVQLPTKYFQINNPRFIFKDKKCKGKDKN